MYFLDTKKYFSYTHFVGGLLSHPEPPLEPTFEGSIPPRECPKWKERVKIVKALIDKGYSDRIMLSHDWSETVLTFSKKAQEDREAFNPDGYHFIQRRFLPALKQLGVREDILTQIMVENPRRFLEGR